MLTDERLTPLLIDARAQLQNEYHRPNPTAEDRESTLKRLLGADELAFTVRAAMHHAKLAVAKAAKYGREDGAWSAFYEHDVYTCICALVQLGVTDTAIRAALTQDEQDARINDGLDDARALRDMVSSRWR